MIELPKEEYIHVSENGKLMTYCTLRQKAMHVIGLDGYGKPYTRHGKKFYRPYRNFWGGPDKELDMLVEGGLMETVSDNQGKQYWYRFNRKGLDWLGEQLGITIYDEKD